MYDIATETVNLEDVMWHSVVCSCSILVLPFEETLFAVKNEGVLIEDISNLNRNSLLGSRGSLRQNTNWPITNYIPFGESKSQQR